MSTWTKQSIIPELTQEEFDKLPRAHRRKFYKVHSQINQVKYFTEKKWDWRTENRKWIKLRTKTLRKRKRDGEVIERTTKPFRVAWAIVNSWATALKEKYPEAMMTKRERMQAALTEFANTDTWPVPELILPSED